MKEDNNDLLSQLESALKSHDWYYRMSDDNRAYQKGDQEELELKKTAKQLVDMGYGKDAADIYNQYNVFDKISFESFIAPRQPFIPMYKRKQASPYGSGYAEVKEYNDMGPSTPKVYIVKADGTYKEAPVGILSKIPNLTYDMGGGETNFFPEKNIVIVDNIPVEEFAQEPGEIEDEKIYVEYNLNQPYNFPKADKIIASQLVYHLDNVKSFAKTISNSLKDRGVFEFFSDIMSKEDKIFLEYLSSEFGFGIPSILSKYKNSTIKLTKNKMDLDETEFSKEFDNDPALKGGQKKLPDALQKSIIKKEKGVKEDIDLGHEDNEPHMIKSELYRIGKYAIELYKMVDGFEGKGEVDFPAWWQSKITTSMNNMVSAKHYLDFEIKEPSIDAMVNITSDEEVIDEKKLTPAEKRKKEKIVKSMKKDFKGSKPAMYAIATDKAKDLAEMIAKKLQNK